LLVDQRLRGFSPESGEDSRILSHLELEKPDAVAQLGDVERAYLRSASLGMSGAQIAAEQQTSIPDIQRLRQVVQKTLGAQTTAQAVCIALRHGGIAYEDLTDRLPYNPAAPAEFAMLCGAALGFRHQLANQVRGETSLASQTASRRLSKRWGTSGVEAAIRRAYEERLWVPASYAQAVGTVALA
jgi:DNA-binding CsgD family transcriptional regulator